MSKVWLPSLVFVTLLTVKWVLVVAESFSDLRLDLLRNCSHSQAFVYSPSCPRGNIFQISSNRSTCQVMDVALTMEFQRFFFIDDTHENFVVSAQLTAQWKVPCPGIVVGDNEFSFRVDETEFWRPSLIHVNAIEDLTMETKYGRFFVLKLTSDEPDSLRFYWQKIGIFKSQCSLKFQKFPFDAQECSIQILLKEIVDTVRLKIVNSSSFGTDATNDPFSRDIITESSSWILTDFSFVDVYELIYSGNRSYALFTLCFQRRPEFYIFNFISPCCLLNLLSLIVFAIEVSNPDRLMLAVTLLLSLTVTHTEICQHVPPVPQRNLLSNYADLAILHCWTTMIYFSAMIFCSQRYTWLVKNSKMIETIAFLWFLFQILAINIYLIVTASFD